MQMTLRQRLSMPLEMVRVLTSLWDVHTLYLPRHVASRVKEATITAGGGYQVSTADAVQAMLFTLMSDVRGRPLVPVKPQMFTVVTDMLHGLKLKEANLARQFLGNAIETVFLEGGEQGMDLTHHSSRQEAFMVAVAHNARFVHDSITAYRANPGSVLDTVAGFHAMVQQNKFRVLSNYMMKSALQKSASSSYITKFPLHEIDFGAGGPHHAKTDILPWADWWYSATAAVGIDDGKGIIVRLVLPHGAAQQLRGHPMWSELAAEAQLVLAGERTQPFGMLA